MIQANIQKHSNTLPWPLTWCGRTSWSYLVKLYLTLSITSVQSLSRVRFFATRWIAARQAATEEPEIKLPTSARSSKKQESSRKTSTSALLTMPKPLTVWITINCRKFWKRWEYQTTCPASWEICMQVKKQMLELDTEQQTGSKLGKEFVRAVYCHPAYLTYRQGTSCEMLG